MEYSNDEDELTKLQKEIEEKKKELIQIQAEKEECIRKEENYRLQFNDDIDKLEKIIDKIEVDYIYYYIRSCFFG
jgi:hypothetical protein